MSKNQKHQTTNLYEAAYLYCRGFKIVGKERNRNKVSVSFEGNKIADAASDYYNGGEVSAKQYSDAYRTLKDFVFEG